MTTVARSLSYLQDTAGSITTSTINPATGPVVIAINGSEKVRVDNNGYLLVNMQTSTGSFFLQVAGDIYATGTLYAGSIFSQTITGSINTATNLNGGAAGQIPVQSGFGQTTFLGAGSAGDILVFGSSLPTFQNTLTLTSTVASTNTQTGALQVRGGVAIGGNLNVFGGKSIAGINTITNTTQATSTTTGALQVAGGVGIQGNLHVGGTIIGSVGAATSATTSSFATTATNLAGGTAGAIAYQQSPGQTTFLNTGQNNYVLAMSSGVPTWQALSGLPSGNATTASNVAAGTTGQIPYQSAAGTTNFFGPGASGEILVSRGANSSGPLFQNTLTLAGTTAATSTQTGALQVIGGVGIGGNLHVGGTIYGNGTAIRPRVVSYTEAATVTFNIDTTDIAILISTAAAGTITFAVPTGTPFNGQKLILRMTSTNAQTLAFSVASGGFQGSNDMSLPTSSTAGRTDYLGFIYNSTAQKWQCIAKVFGFA